MTMTEFDQSAQPRESHRAARTVERTRLLAGILLLLAVAWSTPLRLISPDTKTDLYLDPVGFMARAMHLWDPQVTWGVLQNQGDGYLFPMGPFFAVVGSVAPMWVAQRLWWTLLLVAGYLGMLWLIRALGFRTGWVPHVAALAYTLAPRVVTTLGGISSEAQPVLLTPLILAPLGAATAGRIAPRRAAAISGLAILLCGGVNATATLLAIVPAGVWLVTRTGWWRRRLTWWWGLAVICATAWWAVPLLLLGRYSPPFLDWIENARMVSSPIDLLDVVRGTTHWLGHLLTAQGPWWPAGYELVSSPGLVLATAVVAAAGLAGLALRAPHRGFLIILLVIGIVVVSLPHSGPMSSPFTEVSQRLLDGPLSPLRNVHKADPLIRLPLSVGLAYLLLRVSAWRPTPRTRLCPPLLRRYAHAGPSAIAGVIVVSVVWSATPAIDGHLAPRGAFVEISENWVEAAAWLTDHADGQRSLIVPAAHFGEYTWGRPLDEPLRSLTDADYAVRDAVPLTPANTIRFLDSVEHGLQTGREVDRIAAALARTGVKYLVLRNDLDTIAAGAPPVLFAGSAIRSTPSLTRAAGFGRSTRDLTGSRVWAVEIYEINHPVPNSVELWPAASVTAASGASGSLPSLASLASVPGPIVFDGDLIPDLDITHRVETDSNRARERFFGITRGQDATSSLTAEEAGEVPDYRPWDGEQLASTATYLGVESLRASSSIATDLTLVGVRPAYRPFAAVDDDPQTAWLTFGDARPSLRIELEQPLSPQHLRVTPYVEDRVFARSEGVATRVRVTTDAGSVQHDLDPDGGEQRVPGLGDSTRQIEIEILDTTRGSPRNTLTGLADVRLPGLTVEERVIMPSGGAGTTDSILLGTDGGSRSDGCVDTGEAFRCVGGSFRPAEESVGLSRSFPVRGEGEFTLAGSLVANPLSPVRQLLVPTEIEDVTASTVRALGPAGAPSAAFDGDPRTAWSPAANAPGPRVTATFREPVTVTGLRLRTRDRWTEHQPTFVRVTVDGRETYGRVSERGELTFAPLTGRTVSVTIVRERAGANFAALEVTELDLHGVETSPLPQNIETACGNGPELVINDVRFDTRVSGTRDAALGFGTMTWTSCAPVGLGYLPRDTVTVSTWAGMSPSTALIARAGAQARGDSSTPAASLERGTPIPGFDRATPTRITGNIDGGREQIIVMSDNSNPGWTARVGGQTLAPLTVDGFRQGFLVPAGVAGPLTIEFAPDATYRLALALGLGLALLLLPMLLGPGRPSAVPAGVESALGSRRRLAVGTGTVLLGLLLGGAGGAAIGVMVILAAQLLATTGRRPSGAPAPVVGGLITAAAGITVLGADLLSSSALELTTRVLVLTAVLGAVAQPIARPAPPDRHS